MRTLKSVVCCCVRYYLRVLKPGVLPCCKPNAVDVETRLWLGCAELAACKTLASTHSAKPPRYPQYAYAKAR